MINFKSDKVLLRGPRVDGTYVVSFEVGEYELENIKDLITARDCILDIKIKIEKEKL